MTEDILLMLKECPKLFRKKSKPSLKVLNKKFCISNVTTAIAEKKKKKTTSLKNKH